MCVYMCVSLRLFFVVTEILFSVVYLQLYILMKPNYIFFHSATRILGVRKNIFYLPDQLITISRCDVNMIDANISLTRTVVRRYASIGDSTLIT